MIVFVVGATGAIGRPLIAQLVAAGHDVIGTARSERKAEQLRAAGADRFPFIHVADAAAATVPATRRARPQPRGELHPA